MIDIYNPANLGALFGASELGLLLARRSGGSAKSADGGSLALLWTVIVGSLIAALYCSITIRAADSALLARLASVGAWLFVCGLILRWYAIVYLGRFFTVDVAIAADHHIVDTGPFRYIRHPSYSGALLAVWGLGICFRNWLGLLLYGVPITLAFMRRIQVEEAALRSGLGEAYVQYSARTRRLIPFLY